MNRLEAAITTWLPEEGLFKDLHKYPQVSKYVNTTLYFREIVKHLLESEYILFSKEKSNITHFCLLTTILTLLMKMNGIMVIRI